MMNWLKSLVLFRLLIQVIQLKKADYNAKIEEIEKKLPDHDKYISIPEFNKLIKERFA